MIWRGVPLCVRHSAALMGLLPGVLRPLDTIPATAYLGDFSGSMFRTIRLIAGRVRVMSW